MDKLTSARRSANMSRIRSSGTAPEFAIAKILRAARIRFRRRTDALPGKPDFVLPDVHKVLMVHGCFWHQHSKCAEGRVPSSNTGYWTPKLARNVRRDATVARKLRRLGWGVIIIWECDLRDGTAVARRLGRLRARAT